MKKFFNIISLYWRSMRLFLGASKLIFFILLIFIPTQAILPSLLVFSAQKMVDDLTQQKFQMIVLIFWAIFFFCIIWQDRLF